MTLRKHQGVDVNGQPIYSLEVLDPLVRLLDYKNPPNWPTLKLEGALAILVLCDFHTYKKAELEPLAAWLCGLGAKYIRTWGGNVWEGGHGYDVDVSELFHAVSDYDSARRLELWSRLMQDGLDDAAMNEAISAEYGMEVTASFEGEVELDQALMTFLSMLEFWDERITPYSVLVVTIGNREWAAKVQQRLDDDEWLPEALGA